MTIEEDTFKFVQQGPVDKQDSTISIKIKFQKCLY